MKCRWIFVAVCTSVTVLGTGLPIVTGAPPAAISQEKGEPAKPKGEVPRSKGVAAKGTFVPHAGYLRTNKQLFLNRKNADRANRVAPGAAPPLMLRGARALPVILLEYKNVPAPYPAETYNQTLFDPAKKSVTQYYRDVSGGRLKITGQVYGWYKLPQQDTYYENNQNGGGKPFGEMLEFGLKQADTTVDFGQFDNDGPDGRPNSGDDDGVVDTLLFIHPEVGAENGGEYASNIWSHSWHYSEPSYGHSGPFPTGDIRKNSLGEPVLNPDGSAAHIVVEDYTIQPGLSKAKGADGKNKVIEIGVICHEYGHALGLPDLYDRTPQGGPDSEGIGNYCLMAGGSYGGDGEHPDTPVEMSAWCKYFLGWAPVQTITSDGPLNFEPVQQANLIYRIFVPNTAEKEYFLVEFRKKDWVGLFPGRVNWDEYLPSSGLAIWHVDERVGSDSPTWPFTGPDQGQNDSAVKIVGPPARFAEHRPMVALVQADGRMELEKAVNRGDEGDLWPLDDFINFSDDPTCTHGSRSYDSRATGIQLAQINLGSMLAEVKAGNGPGTPTLISAGPAAPTDAPRPAAPGPAVRNATPPVPAPATEKRALASARPPTASGRATHGQDRHIKLLRELDREVKKGTRDLGGKYRESLQDISPRLILDVVDHQSVGAIMADAARARTEQVTTAQAPQTSVGAQCQKLAAQGLRSKELVVRFAPTSAANDQRVERITQLSIQALEGSPEKDALSRIEGDLKPLLGEGVRVVPQARDASGSPQRFQQVLAYQGADLPVFGREVDLYYDKQNFLTAVTNSTLPPQLIRVTGGAEDLPPERVKELVSQHLGVPAKVLSAAPQKGVFLVDDDPNKGRVAYSIQVPAGPNQREIQVRLDAQTQQILDIR